ATGYYRLGLWDDEPADPLQSHYDGLDDIVATTAQVFLGMTMNCARCHNHKIDPIPQTDYYRLLAFFQDIPEFSETRQSYSKYSSTDISPAATRAKYENFVVLRDANLAELQRTKRQIEDAAIKKMPRATEGPDRQRVLELKLKDFLDPDQKDDYDRIRTQYRLLRRIPGPPRDLALSINHCAVYPPATHVMIRGNPHNRGALVEPGFPAILGVPH